ncbi:MAG: DedA family protein [Corynebacterium sp.]|uniref:DedA family protein n=1 Tax=Corynebacterium TaxID=1716 RepID=UPI002648FCE4|nr:DedA family protein [Corynebacterium sp.]MDN5721393.1 DedA family protein [Corynebacterium sp.]MDN6281688.1 DedA family protein [Corynebacterium sp.]MDN6304542.1 DedA family protein [Corynebacterium sp.]MDN6353321.1 DedA family protein [Corynebacterium sp.]MDN6366267.1 DedA family protein [Corynebacterium sp.]
MFDTLADWAVTLMDTFGGVGVGLAILLETVFPPIPSELVLPMAGFASTQGELNVWAAIAGATTGSMVGAWLLYWLGVVIGAERLRSIADRIWLTDAADVDKALTWFSRFGEISILIGRLIPGVRSLISIPAGIHGMGVVKFSALTLLGSGVWNGVLIWLGVLLGENWTVVSDTMDRYSTVAYMLLVLAVVACVFYLVRRDRKRKQKVANGGG